MKRLIVLDSGPLGLLAHTKLSDEAIDCTRLMRRVTSAGNQVVIPDTSDYEVRRELLRIGSTKGLLKLESLHTFSGVRYLSIDTPAMRLAASLWADARRSGQPTAAPEALDADAILAAQALGLTADCEVIVATANAGHIARYVSAAHWREIEPESKPTS